MQLPQSNSDLASMSDSQLIGLFFADWYGLFGGHPEFCRFSIDREYTEIVHWPQSDEIVIDIALDFYHTSTGCKVSVLCTQDVRFPLGTLYDIYLESLAHNWSISTVKSQEFNSNILDLTLNLINCLPV